MKAFSSGYFINLCSTIPGHLETETHESLYANPRFRHAFECFQVSSLLALKCGEPVTIASRSSERKAAIVHLPCYYHPGSDYNRVFVRDGLRQLQHLREEDEVFYECCYSEAGMVEVEDLFSWFLPNAQAITVVRSARSREAAREMAFAG